MKKMDYILLFVVFLLSIFGLLMVYSSSNIWADYKFHDSFHYLKYQFLFFIVGIVFVFLISKIHYRFYYTYANQILIFSLILLILVLIPGIGSIRNGSRSWFGIGSFGIQPSEAAKISILIFTSKYLSRSDGYINSFIKGIFPILFIVYDINSRKRRKTNPKRFHLCRPKAPQPSSHPFARRLRYVPHKGSDSFGRSGWYFGAMRT